MSSYEVTVPGVNRGMPMQGQSIANISNTKLICCAVKPCRNLTGHNLLPYQVHGGKSVPIIKDSGDKSVMAEGDYFAIETFGTTGKGWVQDDGACSHYAKIWGVKPKPLK